MFRKHKRFLGGLVLIAILAVLVLILASRSLILDAARGRITTDPESAAPCNAALVLGCVRVLPNGRDNLYFRYRIEAAAALYHAGKVRHVGHHSLDRQGTGSLLFPGVAIKHLGNEDSSLAIAKSFGYAPVPIEKWQTNHRDKTGPDDQPVGK